MQGKHAKQKQSSEEVPRGWRAQQWRGRRDAWGTQPHKQNIITRQVNHWCNRLLGAVSEGSFDQEAEYASHRTTRDYVCNTIGIGAFGMVFPLLSIVVTQLCGVEQAGMFSLAFVAGSLLMVVANYGARTYQVSDIDEAHAFSDYQVQRVLTCILMLIAGWVYCQVRGYSDAMFTISMGMYVYKMFDGLGDVYEGRLQQVDKLYLAGISQAFRAIASCVVFAFCLLITRDLPLSCVVMAVTAGLTFVVFTLPLAYFETPKSRRVALASVWTLTKQCFPLFLALFLYTLIDYMPVFVMEGVLSYDNQLYYNALYFPAQSILLIMGVVYKPLLVRIANVWADADKRHRFDLITVGILVLIVAFTGFMVLVMGWIGLPIMSFLYGVDFGQYQGLCFIFLIAGGVTAAIDFLYQLITVLRRQRAIMKLYLITFGFALFVPVLLIDFTGLPGAVIGYLIVMVILLVLLIWEYVSIRIDLWKHPEHAEVASGYAAAGARAMGDVGEKEPLKAEKTRFGRQHAGRKNADAAEAGRAMRGETAAPSQKHGVRRGMRRGVHEARIDTPICKRIGGRIGDYVGRRSASTEGRRRHARRADGVAGGADERMRHTRKSHPVQPGDSQHAQDNKTDMF